MRKHIREEYQKTASGKNWSTVVVNKEINEVSKEFYKNFINSIPYFNRGNSYCRGYKTYTSVGYVITEVVTINPDKTIKYIDRFIF